MRPTVPNGFRVSTQALSITNQRRPDGQCCDIGALWAAAVCTGFAMHCCRIEKATLLSAAGLDTIAQRRGGFTDTERTASGDFSHYSGLEYAVRIGVASLAVCISDIVSSCVTFCSPAANDRQISMCFNAHVVLLE